MDCVLLHSWSGIYLPACRRIKASPEVKAAYKTIYLRFFVFFVGSAIAVGILLPYNDPTLVIILIGNGSGGGTAAASPYVIVMKNLNVSFPRQKDVRATNCVPGLRFTVHRQRAAGYIHFLSWKLLRVLHISESVQFCH